MKSVIFILSILAALNLSAQPQFGWELGVNMTHTDFDSDRGNNYNQHIGSNASFFIYKDQGRYFRFYVKNQIAVERLSTFIRFPNQQFYWRFIPYLEYEVSPIFSVSTGLNYGRKLLEYSFDSYGKNKAFDNRSLNQNRINLRYMVGLKYIRSRVYIYTNLNFEIISDVSQFAFNTDPNDYIGNGGLLEVGLGYFLDESRWKFKR